MFFDRAANLIIIRKKEIPEIETKMVGFKLGIFNWGNRNVKIIIIMMGQNLLEDYKNDPQSDVGVDLKNFVELVLKFGFIKPL